MSVFNYYPLRKAFQKKYDAIMLLLLNAPHVLPYAMRQDGRYDEIICRFSEQYISTLSTPLTQTQVVFLHAFRRYPATQLQAGNPSIVSQSLFGISETQEVDEELAKTSKTGDVSYA